MVIKAIVQEDGRLIAKAPKGLWGKHVLITIHEQEPHETSQWEQMSSILQEIDDLELPSREFSEILDTEEGACK